MLIASLSLIAFPFMSGFYSKDNILESLYGHFSYYGTVVYMIANLGAIFTSLYSIKVLYLTFLTSPNGPLINYKQVNEGDIYMNLPLIILALFSIYFGYITKDIFIGLASGFFSDNSLFIHPLHEIMLDTEFAVKSILKLLPLALTASVSIISLVLFELLSNLLVYFKFTKLGYNIFSFFNKRFYIELFYNKYIIGLIFKLGGQTTKLLDKGSVELLGPYGLEKGLINLSKNIAKLDTGIVTFYALYILIGIITFISIPYIYSANNSLLFLILFAFFTIIVLYYNNHYLFDYEDKYSITVKSDFTSYFDSLLIIAASAEECAIQTNEINAEARIIAEAALGQYSSQEHHNLRFITSYMGTTEAWINENIPRILSRKYVMMMPHHILAGLQGADSFS